MKFNFLEKESNSKNEQEKFNDILTLLGHPEFEDQMKRRIDVMVERNIAVKEYGDRPIEEMTAEINSISTDTFKTYCFLRELSIVEQNLSTMMGRKQNDWNDFYLWEKDFAETLIAKPEILWDLVGNDYEKLFKLLPKWKEGPQEAKNNKTRLEHLPPERKKEVFQNSLIEHLLSTLVTVYTQWVDKFEPTLRQGNANYLVNEKETFAVFSNLVTIQNHKRAFRAEQRDWHNQARKLAWKIDDAYNMIYKIMHPEETKNF